MIYILDDDPYVRRGLGLLLRSAGFEHTLLDSVEEFLDKFPPQDTDLLILEMHMPGMGGCDLLEYFSQNEIYVPVIIITAYDEPFSRECAKKYGAIAYLRKPIDGEALIDLINYSKTYVC